MQIIAILIGLVLLAAIAFYVSRPIVQQRRGGADATVMASLEAQRDAVYSQIRELDMDHATGKMNDEDYHQARADLVAQAANLLRQIDGVLSAPIVPASTAAATLPAATASAGDDVEALIAARRKTTKPAPVQSGGDDVEAAIAARRKQVAVVPPLDDVEALIAARRKSVSKPAVDDVEAAIAARRKSAAPAPSSTAPLPTAAACPTCGKAITPDDAFCSKCGTPLKAAAH
ncbi:MAG: zinc ribbon domain-containing protein [Chloroflexi bacterium]|nr:zinc ribbon domain-containing protein [Chloroflexota bacterium]